MFLLQNTNFETSIKHQYVTLLAACVQSFTCKNYVLRQIGESDFIKKNATKKSECDLKLRKRDSGVQ